MTSSVYEKYKTTVTVGSKMTDLLKAARAKGVEYPKIKLGPFTFVLATDTSANPGSVYILWDRDYLGKIRPDGRISNVNLDAAMLREIQTLLSDIPAAATAYGRRTGNCCICGRKLTARESVAHSIGPICADKYGFQFAPASDTIDIPDDF